MSLRRFLDTAYYLLVEEYQRIGVNLMEALDKTETFKARKADADEKPPAERQTEAQNDASLRELQKLMMG